ncbi:hypothetical protein [Commensalibacter nepenthis]|uniref:Uncharacterized protein n=1 Tax=Commensalibacter nepenthis TaxID=3043872 RepID=A0ABT6Q594_9PROT|nr:hypothetical protein [Commensalibacter sp. TBRC 10068]MDI2112067.1 hypothetical protein [Commensalibacter sp. TBRC 10068]
MPNYTEMTFYNTISQHQNDLNQKQDAFYKALVQATNESVKVATNKMNEFFEKTFPKINSTFMAYEKHLDTTLTQIKNSKILDVAETNGKQAAQKQLNEGLQYSQLVANQNQAFSNINIALQQIINIMKKPTMKETLQTMDNISNASGIPMADLYANRQLMGNSNVSAEKADEDAKKINDLFTHKDNLMQSDWIKSIVEAQAKDNPELLKQLQQAKTQSDFSNLLRENIEAIYNKKDKSALDKTALKETLKHSDDDDVYTSYTSSGAKYVSSQDQENFKNGGIKYAKQRLEEIKRNPGYAAQVQGETVEEDYKDRIKQNIQTHHLSDNIQQTRDIRSEAAVGGVVAKKDQETIDDWYNNQWKSFFDNVTKYFKNEYKDFSTPESLKEVESVLISLAKIGNLTGVNVSDPIQGGTELFNLGITNTGAATAANSGKNMPNRVYGVKDIKTYEVSQQELQKNKDIIALLNTMGVAIIQDQKKGAPPSKDPGNNIANGVTNSFTGMYGTGYIPPDMDNPNSIAYKLSFPFSLKTKDGGMIPLGEKLDKIAANIRPFTSEIAKQNMAALKEKGFNIGLDTTTKQIGILQNNGKMLLPLKELIQLPLEQLLKNLYSNPEILRTLQQQKLNNDAAALKKKNSQSPSSPNIPDNVNQNKKGLLSPVLMPKKTSSLPIEEIIKNSINKQPSLPYSSSYNTNSKLMNQILNMPRSISQKLNLSITVNQNGSKTTQHTFENNIPISKGGVVAASNHSIQAGMRGAS